MGLKVIEFFGGLGACSTAIKNLGLELELLDYVEIDKYAKDSFNAIHGTDFTTQDITKWDKNFEDVDLIMHGSPCFTGETLINTENGFKRIKDVCVGDLVKTIDNSYQKVLKVGSDGHKNIINIKSSNCHGIKTTSNHPFYIYI